jgi:hypothetical protein
MSRMVRALVSGTDEIRIGFYADQLPFFYKWAERKPVG